MSKRKRPAPFSIRLTSEQRERLLAEAGDMPLGAYIIARVLDADAPPPPRQRRGLGSEDRELIGRALGQLGQSRLANNFNQLAKLANSGALPVTPDTEAALQQGVAEIAEMRRMLITALGLDSGQQ